MSPAGFSSLVNMTPFIMTTSAQRDSCHLFPSLCLSLRLSQNDHGSHNSFHRPRTHFGFQRIDGDPGHGPADLGSSAFTAASIGVEPPGGGRRVALDQ